VTSKIRIVESTEPKFRLTPSTEPDVSAAAVARALGAEPAGPPTGFAVITFAALRARVAALIAAGGPGGAGRDPFDFAPHLRASLDQLTAELRADGLVITPAQLAAALLEMSVEVARADRAAVAARLRERAARAGGQPT
jgi:hypothetical protein